MDEETNKKLNDLLKQVAEIVPTMLFIGMTADKQGATYTLPRPPVMCGKSVI